MSLVRCPSCGKRYEINKAAFCPHCGVPTSMKCPKCGSTKIDRVSGVKSLLRTGLLSSNTAYNEYKCRKCGKRFKQT